MREPLSSRHLALERGHARAFVAACLLAGSAFGVLATALQRLLQRIEWVDPMIVSTSPVLAAMLLLTGGVYPVLAAEADLPRQVPRAARFPAR